MIILEIKTIDIHESVDVAIFFVHSKFETWIIEKSEGDYWVFVILKK